MSDSREDPPYPKSTEVDGFPQPYPPQYPEEYSVAVLYHSVVIPVKTLIIVVQYATVT
ncbi:putative lipopolysaccharide-induced transcription factor regulating tumor necrosis factor alpha [Schistosoma mansoni]|uniref:putative lipopolysaccharide-induced transcription factor regulating tumor necrosis factor alpha n=1 Tax=Schistosoma mansoni TaxID=6183 RepID=UPI00022DCA85|nr:putative lipopolysaccharide-induced transcription factor regulating tumor necrosis factor alpha [Schistosoma mansoni]|eukprot:XP_018654953.1 putative lipopolysaccharide-induced transcription factor regulating tumor necrosis factor alpha [Schistosoma mansoni]